MLPSLTTDQQVVTAVPSEDHVRYKVAVGLIALWKVMGMTQAEAWRALHPGDAELSDGAVKVRAHRHIAWFQERYELRWVNLGIQELEGRRLSGHESCNSAVWGPGPATGR